MLKFDPPIHPGEILREDYMRPMGLSAYSLAKELHVPRTRIERLASEKTSVTPDTALRLGKFFGTSPQLWTNMQASYDLTISEKAISNELGLIRQALAA
jgi:antitoxin HigA-1